MFNILLEKRWHLAWLFNRPFRTSSKEISLFWGLFQLPSKYLLLQTFMYASASKLEHSCCFNEAQTNGLLSLPHWEFALRTLDNIYHFNGISRSPTKFILSESTFHRLCFIKLVILVLDTSFVYFFDASWTVVESVSRVPSSLWEISTHHSLWKIFKKYLF